MAEYPLRGRFLQWGLWAAYFGGLVFMSPLAGLSFLVLFGIMGFLWRRAEPPVLAFCLMLQWLAVTSAYFSSLVTGVYPGGQDVGNLEGAVLLSLIGLVVLAAGVRAGLYVVKAGFDRAKKALQASTSGYDVRALFWCVIAVYALEWFAEIRPMDVFPRGAQVIYNVLAFREVLLCLLFVEILQRQNGYGYGAVALLYVLIPSFTSPMASFAEILYLFFIVLLSEWRPWSKSLSDRRRTSRVVRTAGVSFAALLIMGLIWVGGVKPVWRQAVWGDTLAGASPMEKLEGFYSTVQVVVPEIEWASALETLAARLSAGLEYFSIVLERVPNVVPHADGALTLRTLVHLITPRIFFPDKPDLISSSWLIRQYAGVWAAADEEGTSVGLGYMAEFYIDFGVPGMFGLILLYGLGAGLAYGGVLPFAPSYNFFKSAITVAFLQHFTGYAGEIPKVVGGLVETSLIFGLLVYLLGPWLHRMLLVRTERAVPQE